MASDDSWIRRVHVQAEWEDIRIDAADVSSSARIRVSIDTSGAVSSHTLYLRHDTAEALRQALNEWHEQEQP